MKVRIGKMTVGYIEKPVGPGGKWTAFRITEDSIAPVGESDSQDGALNLVGVSIVHQLMYPTMPPAVRAQLQSVIGVLKGYGLGEIATMITDAMKEQT